MKLKQLQDLVDKIESSEVLDDSYRIPSGKSVLSGWKSAYKKLSLRNNQIILVERADSNFFRSCKIKLSPFRFSKLAYDKIQACRTTGLFVINGIDNISEFFKIFNEYGDFYKTLLKVKNQKISYREPNYYKEADYYLSDDPEWMMDEDECLELTSEECYDIYLDHSIEEQVSFDADSPFSAEDYEEIGDWVELESNGERVESSQIYSKKIHGHTLVGDLSFYEDEYISYGEEGEPYIKEIIIGRSLIPDKVFSELVNKGMNL